ncbi:hypothetical protein L6452_30678 [Arctium lappa]|uniref:Uncharacterized protein n=1 Tax=Arctium lappa TaxID=4217 RepID=A0ACB8ZN79_ARCLA|nr:hypothetical protein L6452_30678 [Arctium lappa]
MSLSRGLYHESCGTPAIVPRDSDYCHYRESLSRQLYRSLNWPKTHDSRMGRLKTPMSVSPWGGTRWSMAKGINGLRIVMSSMAWELGSGYVVKSSNITGDPIYVFSSPKMEMSLPRRTLRYDILELTESLETGNLSRIARMIMYGTFIMTPGQCYDEPMCYVCILELPWYGDRWGSEEVSRRVFERRVDVYSIVILE